MASREDNQTYIDEMVQERGYVLEYHGMLTQHDFDVMRAANDLVDAAHLKQRRLDRDKGAHRYREPHGHERGQGAHPVPH